MAYQLKRIDVSGSLEMNEELQRALADLWEPFAVEDLRLYLRRC
jgi:hypothetical protein